eukprot:TRINITY_DN152_c0_g1_i1.p2 TRINITY_DN152_c0_g1~~TRINITY_DN152_c0_g1_i1.p2  ORF type:complete len:148 (+),score=47.24 TRINITY_DN152_c0_g1_i1:541-984(+)
MATRAHASAVFNQPIDVVWKHVRDFDFPARLLTSTIEKVELEGSASSTAVGAVRKIQWKNGEWRRQRLIELSDQYHKIVWESIESEPSTEASAIITSIKLYRISETNSTLVEWSSDFSADAANGLIVFETKSYLENLKEMRETLSKH